MEEKQCKEKNVMNKAWFLYDDSGDSDDPNHSDHSDYADSDDSDDETDNDSVASSVDEYEDDVDVYKLGVDFVNFKESQNISIL